MKLWLISQDDNNDYDTWDSAVVAAESEGDARRTYPGGRGEEWINGRWIAKYADGSTYEAFPRCWTSPENVQATEIGLAAAGVQAGVLCASFNAG